MERIMDRQELRTVYCNQLIQLAEQDERIVALDADLSKAHGTGPFRERFPQRHINVGVAEANMAGVAAGLAASGKIPFLASFTPFATRRIYDQIAVSLAYANLHAVIVGSDPGIAAELNGGTHMSMEDMAIMRAMPNMKVVEISDANQLIGAMPVIRDLDGPVYLRLFRKVCRQVYDRPPPYRFGRGDVLRDGGDAAIFASGIMVAEALLAAESLNRQGIQCAVINLHTWKPLDEELVLRCAATCGCLVTAENGTVKGGLGSAVAELTAQKHPVPVEMVGVEDVFGIVGGLEYLREYFGLTGEAVEQAVRAALERKARRPAV